MIRAAASNRSLAGQTGVPRWDGPIPKMTWQDVAGTSRTEMTLLMLFIPTIGEFSEVALHDVPGGPSVGGYRTFLGYNHGTKLWRVYTTENAVSRTLTIAPGSVNGVALAMDQGRTSLRVDGNQVIDSVDGPPWIEPTNPPARTLRVGADLSGSRLTDLPWAVYDRVFTAAEHDRGIRWMRQRTGLYLG